MNHAVSIFAFTPFALRDGERVPLVPNNRTVRAVLSHAQVFAPPEFFAKIPDVRLARSEESITLTCGENVLCVLTDTLECAFNGEPADFCAKREKDYLCLPAVQGARALGFDAAQFDQMAVVASAAYLDMLKADSAALDQLTRKTCGIYNAACFTSADFKEGRDAWRRDLCGDAKTNDITLPGMKNLLEMRDQDSEDLRRQMNRGEEAVNLFGTEPPVESAELKRNYDRILRMAQPYGTVGCRGYQSPALLEDIVYALDWMHDHMYGAKVLSDESYRSYRIFNWWEWYVGGSCPMMDTVMIIYDDISREQVQKYVLPMSFIRTQMRVALNNAEGMSRILPLAPLALLTEDRALLQAVYLDEAALLDEHDTGDNMRRDWCCMTHGLPYNICYGTCNLARVAKLLNILDRTPLAFTIPKKYNLMNMARYTFAPVLYRGRGLNLMNGRYMQTDTGTALALSVLNKFYNLFGLFGDEEDRELYEILHRNATDEVRRGILSSFAEGIMLETYRKINISSDHPQVPKTHIASYGQYMRALCDEQYDAGPYVLGYMWHSGDCCIQFRHGRMAALRMNSERAPGYESINDANQDAWYTGDGMLYLYTPRAPEQYDRAWWKGADKYLMPGTTVEDRPREARSIRYGLAYRSSQDFVGGVDLERQFVVASMNLESFHNDVDLHLADDGYGVSHEAFACTLTAMKSWFMLDRAIVALGTQIRAQDHADVRTVIENCLLPDGPKGILINGDPLPTDFHQETRSDIERVFIPTIGGFLFPQGGRMTLRLYKNAEGEFFAFWLEHGDNPDGTDYAYIILPDAAPDETAAYDMNGIRILRNDEQIQAVREEASGLTGLVFRTSGTIAGFTADQPMIAMMHATSDSVSVAACDPTQKRENFIFSVADVSNVSECDARMTAEPKAGGLNCRVSCDASRGRGYRAVFAK